jgi:archaellum component FlaG (FlaF/FlaG flagellin family)
MAKTTNLSDEMTDAATCATQKLYPDRQITNSPQSLPLKIAKIVSCSIDALPRSQN